MHIKKTALAFLATALMPVPALAHIVPVSGNSGFVAGFVHPWSGLDHLLAMFAVGVWGAVLGGRAVWKLPVTFPLVMVVGGIAGMIVRIDASIVEFGVALAAFVLGACIALYWKPREWIALVPVCIFALLHGYAHGTELPYAANPALYAAGFVIATGMIHVIGVFVGLGALRLPRSVLAVRIIGAGIALAGLWLCSAWL